LHSHEIGEGFYESGEGEIKPQKQLPMFVEEDGEDGDLEYVDGPQDSDDDEEMVDGEIDSLEGAAVQWLSSLVPHTVR
jgi:hypothetical protein